MFFSFCIGIIDWVIVDKMRPFQKTLKEDSLGIDLQIIEAFSGITVVRGFCQERKIRNKYVQSANLLQRKILYENFIGFSSKRIIWFINYFMQASIWLFCGCSVIKGRMTIGEIVVVVFLLPFIFRSIFNIMMLLPQFQKSLACAERVFELLDDKPSLCDYNKGIVICEISKGIEFHNVTFNYPDGTKVLKNISIKIPKGKTTAIVGPSGCGKTTLINLILRFYEASEGNITIDDIDIQKVKLSNYRKLLTLVLQEVFLFDATIKENIAFGNQLASQQEIETVAKITNCHAFIQELAQKYDTYIGERGIKLSGGQKQRIALARALLVDPQIFIFDEATSNLDVENEHFIQHSLKKVLNNKTVVIATHRLSTITSADNIVVIEGGRVVEQGTYQELIEHNGLSGSPHHNLLT